MDHGHMDHGMDGMCQMSMIFTWNTQDLCIIFSSWHIRSTAGLIFSLLGVVALTAGYELVREVSRRYESGSLSSIRLGNDERASDEDLEPSSLLGGAGSRPRGQSGSRGKNKTVQGLLYAVQVFYSFFIMLLFMTYNGWVMLAVAVGAFVGYMVFATPATPATKTVACH